ncbi:MAG: hypothetical protein ACK55Z_05620, partial [bacterium]
MAAAVLPAALRGGDEDRRLPDGRGAPRGPCHLAGRGADARAEARQFRHHRQRPALPAVLPAQHRVRRCHDGAVPVHRLSVRLLHGARQALGAAGAADAGDAAVLDL